MCPKGELRTHRRSSCGSACRSTPPPHHGCVSVWVLKPCNILQLCVWLKPSIWSVANHWGGHTQLIWLVNFHVLLVHGTHCVHTTVDMYRFHAFRSCRISALVLSQPSFNKSNGDYRNQKCLMKQQKCSKHEKMLHTGSIPHWTNILSELSLRHAWTVSVKSPTTTTPDGNN